MAVGQVRGGACGTPSAVVAELARDPEARAVRVQVEDPEQGAPRAVEAAAREALVGVPGVEAVVARGPARAVEVPAREELVGVQGVKAAVAQAPAGVVLPVEDLVGAVQAREGLQAVGGPERASLENG